MAKINRNYIDRHWMIFILRGILAILFGAFALFEGIATIQNMIAIISIMLLIMGIIDTTGALYAANKKHGWFVSVIDAAIDVAAALMLLFFTNNDLTLCLVVLSVYTVVSGIIDIFHGFLSTVDPTDRFIRIFSGAVGCIMGLVILNAGDYEVSTFIRFFGVFMLIVGSTSLIYGVHNRSQEIEDKVARSQARKKTTKKTAKKTTKKKK